MTVREEIEKFSDPEERSDLLLVFGFYHMQSEWNIMSTCEFIGTFQNAKRKWHLSPIGKAVASQHRNSERVRILREAAQRVIDNWSEGDLADAVRELSFVLEATKEMR